MVVSVVGTGYVGLSTGLVLASLGNEVYFVDLDPEKIKNLQKGKSPFHEEHLEKLLKKSLKNRKAHFTTKYSEAIPNSEAVFICVGTPPKINGEADTRQVINAVKETAKYLNKKAVSIVLKSTVPVGTAVEVKKLVSREGNKNISILSNPEFLREGHSIEDTLKPDRIVIGVDSDKEAQVLLKLYEPIIKQSFENIVSKRRSERVPVLITSNSSAELIKYAANAFLATKISFINEIANIAENVGADISDISKGIGLDPRIGSRFLNAGIGWGGSCFPKDVRALHQIAGNSGYMPVLLKSVIEVNNEQRYRFLQKIVKALNDEVEGKTVCVLGLAFKGGTDDVRESPAIEIINKLLDLGAKVKTYDPMAIENAKKILNHHSVEFCDSPYEAASKSDVLVITTDWEEFKQLDFDKLKKNIKTRVVIDGKNLLSEIGVEKKGFKYISVGGGKSN